MRDASVLWANLQLIGWKDRAFGLALAIALVAFLIGTVGWGANIGAHVGAKGWSCGQRPKGSPYCVQDTTLRPDTYGDSQKL